MAQTGTTIWTILAAVLGSGVMSSFVTYRLNRSKEQTFFMRQKAEALCLATDKWVRFYGQHTLYYIGVAAGSYDYNDMLDMQIKAGSESKSAGHETMVMLTRIYFPEIELHLDEMFSARDQFGDLATSHKEAYKEGDGVGSNWVNQFKERGLTAHKAANAFQQAIVEQARRYAQGGKIERILGIGLPS